MPTARRAAPTATTIGALAEGVALDTDRIELHDMESDEPLRVDVERRGNTVVFSWLDVPRDEVIVLTCTKQ